MITGVRGLCNGLGPALYGLIFYLFHVDLNDKNSKISGHPGVHDNSTVHIDESPVMGVSLIACLSSITCGCRVNILKQLFFSFLNKQALPGPPFVFGSFLVVCALLVAFFIPEGPLQLGSHLKTSTRRSSGALLLEPVPVQ